jgi:hypothetical protein
MRGSRHRAARVSIGLQSPQERRPQIEVFRRDQDRDGGLYGMIGKFAEIFADELEIAVNSVSKLRDKAELLGFHARVLRDQQPLRRVGAHVGRGNGDAVLLRDNPQRPPEREIPLDPCAIGVLGDRRLKLFTAGAGHQRKNPF